MSTPEQQKSYHVAQQLIQNLASQTGDFITNPPETALFVITGYRKTNGQTISAYTKGADNSQVFIDMFTAACEQSPDLAYVLGIAISKSNSMAKNAFNQGALGGEPY
jgi:hypothetical protein